MSCGCDGRKRNSTGTIPASGSANQNGTISLGTQGGGMTQSGFCLKCFSFWFWVAAAIIIFWVLTEK